MFSGYPDWTIRPAGIFRPVRAHSSAWLERIPDKDEAPGSSPGGPTNKPPRQRGFLFIRTTGQ